ncbi:a disintegrin and metalloproteinase with thrombospondin motifs [Nesidiocoris tenuis]|uniref:A disintegrin and metalloproteinase with thrombospondin motifs n=1 Tax=Nesidiocoris tenuis TaxID=355587 RepID=A0ABN7BC09_9HEMI|nr:a disintegrin and metalloproteinase with thrombospondin motifs [Nesidiocoris tenuis]
MYVSNELPIYGGMNAHQQFALFFRSHGNQLLRWQFRSLGLLLLHRDRKAPTLECMGGRGVQGPLTDTFTFQKSSVVDSAYYVQDRIILSRIEELAKNQLTTWGRQHFPGVPEKNFFGEFPATVQSVEDIFPRFRVLNSLPNKSDLISKRVRLRLDSRNFSKRNDARKLENGRKATITIARTSPSPCYQLSPFKHQHSTATVDNSVLPCGGISSFPSSKPHSPFKISTTSSVKKKSRTCSTSTTSDQCQNTNSSIWDRDGRNGRRPVHANSTGHLIYQLLEHEEPLGETYQDVDNQAALLIHQDKDGSLLYEGTIGHDFVVRPLPKSARRRLNNNDIPGTAKFNAASDDLSKSHVIFKRKFSYEAPLSDYALMEPGDELHQRAKRSAGLRRSRREAPYVIYPEILVIVDYDGYRLHGGDNVQIKRYFISFWNGVDLRYKLLKGPKVRISIAGIIISRGRDATPYLERNRVGRDAIDSAAALTDMGKYLFRERRLPVYDIAVAITKYDMCRRRKGGRCTKGTAGFAYVGGACVVNKRLEKVNSVAIIEDTGGFSGIIVAAHEVGHLLGAVHDGSPPPTYLGGPGAERCRWEDGYIMSDLRHTEKGFRWSPCSVSSFHHFLNGETATCLYNSPHEDESLPRVLPGKLLSLDAQCRRDRGTSACFKDERVCAQLFCFDSGSGYCVAYRPAAEGSPCGDGQTCNSGRCIVEHENIIPDYSQHAVTYARRTDSEADQFESYNQTSTRSSWSTTATTFTTQSTTSSSYLYSTSTTEKPKFNNFGLTSERPSDPKCVDTMAMCPSLVSRYAHIYCATQYLRKTCCASSLLCP